MRLRHRSIRLRLFLLVLIPILALIGLYAFAATTTASAALSLARSRTVKNTTGLPIGSLEAQVGAERLLAVIYLAAPVPQNLAALRAQELKTDKARSVLRSAVTSAATMSSASPQEKQAVTTLLRDVAGLAAVRSAVTSLTITRPRAIKVYGNIVAAADGVLNQLIIEQTNIPLVVQGLALVGLGKSEEVLLQEDALLAGDMLARSFSAADRQEFTQLVGERRLLYAQTLPELDPIYRSYYVKDVSPAAAAALTALENTVIRDPHPRGAPPVSPASWAQAVGAVSAGFSRAGMQAANELTLRAQPVARATFLRLLVVGGLGLLAVLLSLVMSIWIGRGLLRQLADLRQSALELANDRLPDIMARLRAGQDVDISAEIPPMEPAGDEIGQVREAFNAVQRTAVEAAVDEASLRRGISDVFRNLARRSQSLLHRQLALLDGMERRASGPSELEDLFRIDHLTTRMRRHAEGLIILSGESPGRGWRHPVPLVDVLRAAVAEVEDYTRIRVMSRTHAALAGPAVADVIHLIAELAENATIYSPPNTVVRILGDTVGQGFAVEIEDRGLGIPDIRLDEINNSLARPPQFDLSGSDRLGLFIAGQLAARHDIKITLRPSAYGGTTAIVLIPQPLVVEGQEAIGAAREREIRLTGRHATLSQSGNFDPDPIAESVTSADPAALPPAERPAAAVPAALERAGGARPVQAAAPVSPLTFRSESALARRSPDAVRAATPGSLFIPSQPAQPERDAAAGQPEAPAGPFTFRSEPSQPERDAAAGQPETPPSPLTFRSEPAQPERISAAGQPETPPSPLTFRSEPAQPERDAAAGQPEAPASPFTFRSKPAQPERNAAAGQPEAPASPFTFRSKPAQARRGPDAVKAATPGSLFTPSQPAQPERNPDAGQPEGPPSPFTFRSEPAQPGRGPSAPDSSVTAAELARLGLPRRIRQASLAPQLRHSGTAAPAGDQPVQAASNDEPRTFDGPSPEAARKTMTALQRGWERGRSSPSTQPPEILIDSGETTGELAIDGNDQ